MIWIDALSIIMTPYCIRLLVLLTALCLHTQHSDNVPTALSESFQNTFHVHLKKKKAF